MKVLEERFTPIKKQQKWLCNAVFMSSSNFTLCYNEVVDIIRNNYHHTNLSKTLEHSTIILNVYDSPVDQNDLIPANLYVYAYQEEKEEEPDVIDTMFLKNHTTFKTNDGNVYRPYAINVYIGKKCHNLPGSWMTAFKIDYNQNPDSFEFERTPFSFETITYKKQYFLEFLFLSKKRK